MKRLFALLLLVVTPAFAQEYTPPVIYDPTVEQTYTLQQSTTTSLENVNQSGGTPLTLYDDGTTYQPIQLPFDFYYFGSLFNEVYISQNGFISFTSNANGCCSGMQLPFLSEQSYYNLNNSIFAMWSDLADFNTPGNPYYKATGNSFVVGWYDVDELSSGFSCNQFGCTQGPGNKFTFEISLFADSSFSIAYGDFDYNNITGRTFTSGYQGDTQNEYYTIYYGNNPTVLENKTYYFASSEIVPIVPEEPIAPDCTINPTDPTCIINDLTDYTNEDTMLVDNGSDDGSNNGTEEITEEEDSVEELLADADMVDEEVLDEEFATEEETLEELLADEDEEETVVEERILVYRELSDEEKAAILADSISKTTLESALSIASETGSLTTSSISSGETTQTSISARRESAAAENFASAVENNTISTVSSEISSETTGAGSENVALELLETGRQLGQEALAATMSATEASASDSLSQAENIAFISSNESMSASSTVDIINSITIDNVIEIATTETTTEIPIETTMMVDNNFNADISSSSNENVGFVFAEDNPAAESAKEVEDIALSIVNNSIANSNTSAFDDDSNKDAETTNAMVDPALAMANTFNQPPNLMNLEILGIVKPVEEKSDAEIRAEQVVAANKEQQDAINANYMDADQSGIVAAIGSEADVSSYLSQRLTDVPFYKPEDIYKNIVIKDNVRGSYFLEKGNTDTYKKMIQEQYK